MLLTRKPGFNKSNWKQNERQTVDCVDVILKHSGESIGGSVREYDYDLIKDRLDSGIMMTQLKELKAKHDGKPEEVEQMFADYLSLFKDNPVQRSGMGLGFGEISHASGSHRDFQRTWRRSKVLQDGFCQRAEQGIFRGYRRHAF